MTTRRHLAVYPSATSSRLTTAGFLRVAGPPVCFLRHVSLAAGASLRPARRPPARHRHPAQGEEGRGDRAGDGRQRRGPQPPTHRVGLGSFNINLILFSSIHRFIVFWAGTRWPQCSIRTRPSWQPSPTWRQLPPLWSSPSRWRWWSRLSQCRNTSPLYSKESKVCWPALGRGR